MTTKPPCYEGAQASPVKEGEKQRPGRPRCFRHLPTTPVLTSCSHHGGAQIARQPVNKCCSQNIDMGASTTKS